MDIFTAKTNLAVSSTEFCQSIYCESNIRRALGGGRVGFHNYLVSSQNLGAGKRKGLLRGQELTSRIKN